MNSHSWEGLKVQMEHHTWTQHKYSLVNEFCAHAKSLRHVAQGQRAVWLQQLAVGLDPHFSHVVTVMWCEEPVLLHLLLYKSCDTKSLGSWQKENKTTKPDKGKKKGPYPRTGRRRSNDIRTEKKDTGEQKADCEEPPRSLPLLLPTEKF